MSEEQPGIDPFQQGSHPPQGYYDPQANYYQAGYQQPGHQHHSGYPQHYQQQPYGPHYGYQPAAVHNPAKGMGITSMVLGICSFVVPLMGFLLAAGAVVFGFISRSREPEARGFALAGLILGFLSIAYSLIVFMLFFAGFTSLFFLGV